LLADIRAIFDDAAASSISAKTLLERLVAMEERPWSEANHGRPMSTRQLGVRLRRFGIGSCTVRDGTVTARSYVRADFDDAFGRYLSAQSVTCGTPLESLADLADSEPSRLRLVTDARTAETASDFEEVTDVTDATADAEATYAKAERAAIERFGS
jgi:hypothetical protein